MNGIGREAGSFWVMMNIPKTCTLTIDEGWMDIRLLAWLGLAWLDFGEMCVIIQSSWLFTGYLLEICICSQREKEKDECKNLASVPVATLRC